MTADTLALTGIVHGLEESVYHAHPALSSTGARKLLESPARFDYWRKHPEPHKDAFDLGTAVHSKVLGVGWGVVVLDFPDFRSKAAREARDEARAAGKVVISPAQAALVDAMSEAVLAHPTARILFEQDGHSEVSLFATDPDTGVDVRSRFDFLPNLDAEHPIAVDLKTTGKAASPDEFTKTVANFGYDVQDAHYEFTHALVTGREIPLVFVVVETEPPHLVSVHQLPTVWREMGLTKARVARERFAECTRTGEWPGYPPDVQLLSPPTYAVYQFEEMYGNE